MKYPVKNCSDCPCYNYNDEYMSSDCGLSDGVTFRDSLGPLSEPNEDSKCPLIGQPITLLKEQN